MADGDREVLSSLPRTRPERRSAKRGARTPAGAQAAADGRGKAAPKAPAKPKPRAKPRATSRSQPRPKAVPPREIPPAGYAVPEQRSPVQAGGTELVGTAIQAAGELANLGTRALRDIIGRLPRL
jgi:hypothetical protein